MMSTEDEERVRYECNTCCYVITGNPWSTKVEDKLDKHEEESPGHKMKESKDYA